MAGRRRDPAGAVAGATGTQAAEAAARPEGEAPLAPGQCRAYMRRTLAREFRGIVNGFVEQARSGSCQHVKLATELLEPRRREKRTDHGRTVLEGWMKEMRGGR